MYILDMINIIITIYCLLVSVYLYIYQKLNIVE